MEYKGIALDCPKDGKFYICPKCNYRIIIFLINNTKFYSIKIIIILLINFAILSFMASHLLEFISNYVNYAYFFGFIISMNFFVDIILLLGFIFLFIVIILLI